MLFSDRNFAHPLDKSAKSDIIITLCIRHTIRDIAELCNGSTTDSDSVCWGSNPYSAAKQNPLNPLRVQGIFNAFTRLQPKGSHHT